MIVLCVMNCPPALRGDLSKWLCEVNTGVYVGKLSARVREELWERICDNIKSGQATMVFSANNEQGFSFLTHNTTWKPVDYEGITLMQKPVLGNETIEQSNNLPPGFSKASKYDKLNRQRNNKRSTSYVVISVQILGVDDNRDEVMEIGLLKINENEIEDQFQCFIHSKEMTPNRFTELTGIAKEMFAEQGLQEDIAVQKIQEFIGSSLLVGYHLRFDLEFLEKLGERAGKEIIIKKTKDVQHIARRKMDDLEDYEMETVAAHFSFDLTEMHRALPSCMLIYGIYSKLNEL
ncbi:MAG: type I-E CRISPR-associated endoribonuclease Cas2 [Lachnospiraceae bacterium]|nr:type I-E CRISPR-associated endoribonuclease Cas2 [Lachnospiraceae bacterium]